MSLAVFWTTGLFYREWQSYSLMKPMINIFFGGGRARTRTVEDVDEMRTFPPPDRIVGKKQQTIVREGVLQILT